MRSRQHSLTASPTQKGTDSQKAGMQCCLSSTTPATQSHRKPNPRKGQTHRKPTCIAACLSQFPPAQLQCKGPRQDSLTERSHENPPTQLHRKPTVVPTPAKIALQNPPTQPHRKPDPDSARAPLKITTAVGDAQAPAGMPRRL